MTNEDVAATFVSRAREQVVSSRIGGLLRKVFVRVFERAWAIWYLWNCEVTGAGGRVQGRMRVENRGAIRIGGRVFIMSRWVPTELIAEKDARITIGDDVWINFGVLISAHQKVTIGNRVMIGQYCIIADSQFPDMPADSASEHTQPVEIGDDAWLAVRVTVRPGVKIGKGAIIMAGSIVESDIPAGVIAGGIPARPISRIGESEADAKPSVQGASANVAQPAAAPGSVVPAVAHPVSAPKINGYLISDFTIDELSNELVVSDLHSGVGARVAPFDQVTQSLLSPPPPDAADFAVVWTQPQKAVPSFAKLLAFEPLDDDALQAEVDAFCAKIEKAAPLYRSVFVPSWTMPSWQRGLGMLDTRKGGVSSALVRMNSQLMQRLSGISNVYVLDASRWLAAVGPSAFNPKAWYLGKIAFARPVLAEAARDVRAALASLSNGPRKLLILDLDDTLWGGIVGDVGWEGVKLGGMDASGEAFVDFQKAIKDLKKRGVVLGIVSKNEESVALEAIRSNPSMVLKEQDFVGWKINWHDKARNVAELTQSLNLGLQSVVFIDDNPVERARVREALPEVYVPEWPKEEFLYASHLRNLSCFDAPALTREDAERTRMYDEETQREALRQQVGSIEEWLKTLEIKVTIEPLSSTTSTRAAQLLNKTNQLNLRTRRLTERELIEWAAEKDNAFWVVNVSDRMGDAGLTGLLGISFEGDVAHIVDFVLSCRVMGRRVEDTIVHVAVAAAIERGAKRVIAKYLPTAKNKPCLTFWQNSGFTNEGDREFVWDNSSAYPLPDVVNLEWQK
ncbi:HAD-IIIC family phosphatase [Hyphomicrobium sp.]|uniref:HAD-IIIC family phosphatase n=1 Tax=Hyphomicrobium sp. TaxID=82 RepID=UPI000F95362C|nr:HAD-IIIC family phosphatase [Hyphomicrobium sp.]RUP10139.1 MAG: HAD-IIIC family phosphatase [Hyphomicrobium sp.]